MQRNSSSEALILSVHTQGENNRNVCMITPDGIVYATLYGGPKSRLRAQVSQWNRGKIWLYKDETKKSCKITDFDVTKYHLSFRENLFKSYAANLAAEISVKTKCAGSPEQCWLLVNGLLDGMELSSERNCRLGLLRFIWRFISLLGLKPQTQQCPKCGKSYITGKITADTVSLKTAYDEYENGFVCGDCTDITDRHFILGMNAITYLEAVSDLEPAQVRSIIISEQTFLEIKELCFYLLENACGCRLNSIKSGVGIL